MIVHKPSGLRWRILLLIAFAAVVLTVGLIARSFEYDTDEGLNLMKGMLLAKGHALYAEIWSDQPPVLTWLLAGCYKLFGPSSLAARILILPFSLLLLASLMAIVQRLEGTLAAVLTGAFLAGTSWYVKLSFAVMIGLPAMALAVFAAYLLLLWRDRGGWWLPLLSGAVMGLALQTKFSAVLALPLIVGIFLLSAPSLPHQRRRLLAGLLWCAAAVAIAVSIYFAAHERPDQLVGTHIVASQVAKKKAEFIAYKLVRRDTDLILLLFVSLLGIRRTKLVLPLIWLAITALIVQFHRPAWPHYALLVAAPLAWCAAIGASLLLQHWPRWRQKLKLTPGQASSIIVAMVILLIWRPYRFGRETWRLVGPRDQAWAAVAAMRQHIGPSGWIFSDRPLYPFSADVPVPPALAVSSAKRTRIGKFDETVLLPELDRYQPDQLLLGNHNRGPAFRKFLETNYTPSQTFHFKLPDLEPFHLVHYVRKSQRESIRNSGEQETK